MTRLARRLALLLAVAAALAAAWWYWLPDWLPDDLRRDNPRAADYAPALYTWRDAQGRIQLTDQPPPEGVPFERVRIAPDTNILPAGRGPQ